MKKGKAKGVYLGARFSPDEAKHVNEAVKRAKTDKSKWIRETYPLPTRVFLRFCVFFHKVCLATEWWDRVRRLHVGGSAAFTPLHRTKAIGHRIVDDIRMLKRPDGRAPGGSARMRPLRGCKWFWTFSQGSPETLRGNRWADM